MILAALAAAPAAGATALVIGLDPAPAGAQTAAPAVRPWRTDVVPSTAADGLRDLTFSAGGTGLLSWERFPPKRTTLAVRRPATPWSAATVADLSGITWGNAQVHPYGATRTILFAQRAHGTTGGPVRRATFQLVSAFGRTDGSFGPLRPLAERTSAPVAAVNARGEALVAWLPQDGHGVLVAERPAGARVGPPRTLSRTSPSTVTAAVGADGVRVVAWIAGGTLYARARRPGHPWGPVQRVARPGGGGIDAHVTSRDRLVLAWERVDQAEDRPTSIVAGVAVRGPATPWRATTLERSRGGITIFGAQAKAVTDGTGRTWVAWTGIDRGAAVIRAARLDGAAPLGVGVVSGSEHQFSFDDLAAGPGGALALSFTVQDGTSFATAVATARDGAWLPPQRLTPAGASAIFDSRVAYDPVTSEPVVAAGAILPGSAQRVLTFTGPAA